VEIDYFLQLADKKFFSASVAVRKHLLQVLADFSLQDVEKIKQTEKITNHDVKAVEYFFERSA
jgi:adenylosuccinate lyase